MFVENKDIVILLVLGWLCEVTTKFSFVVYWPNSIRCALMVLYLSSFFAAELYIDRSRAAE